MDYTEEQLVVRDYTKLTGVRKLICLLKDIRDGYPTEEELAQGWKPLRWFETNPGSYTSYTQTQRLWVIEISFPVLFTCYWLLSRLACAMRPGDHEYTPWEHEKYISTTRSDRHCVRCGHSQHRIVRDGSEEIVDHDN